MVTIILIIILITINTTYIIQFDKDYREEKKRNKQDKTSYLCIFETKISRLEDHWWVTA